MTAVIAGSTTPAAPLQPEPRAQSTNDSRFGAELESAKAAIGPDSGGNTSQGTYDKPNATDAQDSTDAGSSTEATPATTAAAAQPILLQAPTDSAAVVALSSTDAAGTLASAAAGEASTLTVGALATSGPSPTDVAGSAIPAASPLDATAVATAPPTNQPTAASADPQPAPMDLLASDVTAPSSPLVVETKKAQEATPSPDSAVPDSAPAGALVVPIVSPLPQAATTASAGVSLPISVAPAAASGPMLVAAATDRSAPSTDAAQPAAVNPGVAASAVPGVAASTPSVVAPPTEVAAPRPVDPPLNLQLARPLAALRSAGNGNHVITIAVTPENLGPVTVRAHVSGDAVRIELVAPTEQAREALKAIMPDLRRDLSQSGGQLSLDLSSGNQPSGREWLGESADSARRQDSGMPSAAASVRGATASRSESALDVLA